MWADMVHLFISTTMFLCPSHLYTGALRGLRIWQSHGDFGLLSKLEIKCYCLLYDFNIVRFISFTRGNHNLSKRKKKVLAWNRVTPWKHNEMCYWPQWLGVQQERWTFFFFYTGKTPEMPSHRITYRAYKVLAESRSRTSFLNKDTITIWDRIIVSLWNLSCEL